MDAAAMVAALLEDKKIGPDFIAARKLSEPLFLHGWNTRELLTGTPAHRSNHVHDMINAPPIHDFPADLCASPLVPSGNDAEAFLNLNLAFLRLSSRHRIWDPADVAYLHQRRPVAGSFMLVSPSNDASSAPVLVITGPLALPLKGTPIQTRAAFGLDPSAPLNLVEGQPPLPSGLLPFSAILDSSTRSPDTQSRLGDQFILLHAAARAMHIMDSRPLHSTVLALDTTDELGRWVQDCPSIRSLNIWAPAAPAQSGSSHPSLDDATFTDWVRTAVIPPRPDDPDLWNHADRTATLVNPKYTRLEYQPNLADKLALLSSSAFDPAKPGSFILLPKFLRLPFSVTVPVGLVFDPIDVTFLQFRALVAFTCHGGDMAATSWMQNPLLMAWYEAARLSPSALSEPVVEHTVFMRYFPDSAPPSALSIARHQLWAMLSQILWDRIFGLARGKRQKLLQGYCASALAHINEKSLAGSYDWGPLHDVYAHPFVPFLIPTQCKAWLKEFLWQDYPRLRDTFPAYMDELRPATPLATDESQSQQSSPTRPAQIAAKGSVLDHASILGDLLARHDLQPPQFNTPPPPPEKRIRLSSQEDQSLLLQPQSLGRTLFSSSDHESVEVTRVTTWDPLQSLRRPSISALEDPWSLPVHQARQSPLPSKHGFTVAHNLALALRFFTTKPSASAPISTTTTTSESSKEKVSYVFSFDMMLRADAPAHHTVRRAAFFGSFRYPEPDVHPLYAVGLDAPPLAVYPTDYLFCPGMLSATFISFLHPAHDKPITSMHFKRLHAHVRDLCLDAMQSEDRSGIECRWFMDFLTPETVQAVQYYAFYSGKRSSQLADLQSVLTPWHFLHSVSPHHHPTRPAQLRLPAGGLPALLILDVFQNMYFLMHAPFLDTCKLAYVGPQHSPASRWSPLFGHFLRVINLFHDRNFQHHWDCCIPAQKGRLTEAIFIAISELIAIFERWCLPKFPASQTFLQGRYDTFDTVVLLNPLIDTNCTQLLKALQGWRQHLVPFSVSGIQCALPTDGFFAIPTPECFRPTVLGSTGSIATQPPSLPPPPKGVTAPPSYQASHPSATSAASRREGESLPNKARICLLVQPDPGKTLGSLLQHYNKDRPVDDHLKPPLAMVPGRGSRRLPLCFRYTTEQSSGCPQQRCCYLHLDMANVASWRQDIPSEFFHKLQRFLDAPAVKPHYQPSPAFRDFLSSR
jgi:hypothetical protein